MTSLGSNFDDLIPETFSQVKETIPSSPLRLIVEDVLRRRLQIEYALALAIKKEQSCLLKGL